jgi:hypothetical protein
LMNSTFRNRKSGEDPSIQNVAARYHEGSHFGAHIFMWVS